ncbi:TonB-dependent hemoglobin/transferrin/lactoferrin family receptor [Marinomonas transparens]|uniref:TonB-dependent hemoglobin/transferrin/lactoferrin family receptor n=1 Tax=Marinomonas transparens TaxID=2795388 RepID=A0A934N6C1_9GAMM|nr:TonB-dependent hemoglobin/transferrin/lactoferrin family receptor [Marinomonas transparens]MBJ7537926.1 TonB-dependent hemoglobin/transferrin/lactoferrin family receptor [Marinomonas transparens]
MRTPYFETPLTLIASAILFASTSALAAPDAVNETQLPTLQVEAKKELHTSSDGVSTVSEITQQDMEQDLVVNLDDLVRFEPGVDASQAARFGISSVNIRGLDGDRLKITVDGVDQANAYRPTPTFLRAGRNLVDLDSLEKVTILKGGNTQAGSGALGGAVKYQTKEPSSFLSPEGDDSFFSFKAGYRSAMDQQSETITAVNRSGKLETLLLYTHRDGHETENYYGDAGSDQTVGATRQSVDPEDNESDNILAKAQYQLDESNRIGVVGEYYNAGSVIDLYSEGADDDFHRADDTNKRQRIGVFWENQQATSAYDQVKWQLDYQNTKTINKTYRESTASTSIVNRYYEEESIDLKADFVKGFSQQDLRYGFNYKQTSLDNLNRDTGTSGTSRFSPLADADVVGAYIEGGVTVTEQLMLVPVLRYDSYQYSTKGDEYFDAYPSSSSEAFTAQIGAEFELTPAINLYGKYGQGFRAPDLDDLYYLFEGSAGPGMAYAEVPNPDLKAETSVFTEVGARAQNDYGIAEFAFFYTDYKDFIQSRVLVDYAAPYAGGKYTKRNLDRVVIKGAEFKGSLNLSNLVEGLGDGWMLNSAIAYAEGENTKEHKPLDSIAPLSAVFGLGYDAPSKMWGTQLNMTFSAGKDKADITTDEQWKATESYQVVDVTGYYKPTGSVTINAGVFNLLDEEYQKWSDVRHATVNTPVQSLNPFAVNNTNLQRYTRAGRNVGVDVTVTF